jgi:hypothetical protein
MHQVINNLLDEQEFLEIQRVMTSPMFPWYYQDSVAEKGQEDHPDFYFSHLLYNTDTKEQSPFFKVCEPILKKAKIEGLFRAKANLYPNLGRVVENLPHIDFPFEHLGAIFYLNTNDGVTILTHEGKDVRIESIANRLLIFDASKEHQSTHCTDKKVRLNINFNFWNIS